MIVTPFGDLDYQSHPMTLQWIASHGIRHQTLRGAFSRQGKTILPAPLFGDVDLEWVRLHYLHHVALLRAMRPDPTVSSQVLSFDPVASEQAFYAWHRMHNLLHTRLDQAFKVT